MDRRLPLRTGKCLIQSLCLWVGNAKGRNGYTGKLINRKYQSGSSIPTHLEKGRILSPADPDKPPGVRIERYKLQNALLSAVPPSLIQLNKKLVEIEESEEGVYLFFSDGKREGPFDLVLGADGIRSVCRTGPTLLPFIPSSLHPFFPSRLLTQLALTLFGLGKCRDSDEKDECDMTPGGETIRLSRPQTQLHG